VTDTWHSAAGAGGQTVALPGGHRDSAGVLQLTADIGHLTGFAEEQLAEPFDARTRPTLVTRLLTDCVSRFGAHRATADMIRGLLVADREYLVLKLRQLSFGSRVQTTLVCPDCRQPLDMEFDVDAIPVEVRHPSADTVALELSDAATFIDNVGMTHRTVAFRLPTGVDEEAVAAGAPGDVEEARTRLLERCLVRIGSIAPVDRATARALNARARAEIEERMDAVAPQVGLEMDVTCPECSHAFVEVLDCAALLFEELRLERGQLYRDVHRLALHYHWSEPEIFALPRGKRHRYLELLRAEGWFAAHEES
jgi:Zn finger protein HypA/HybF involved in hydrogenase expression